MSPLRAFILHLTTGLLGAGALCLPLRADPAATPLPPEPSAPAAAPAPATDEDPALAKQLKSEIERVQRMAAELKTIESAPLPSDHSVAATPAESKAPPTLEDLPTEPAPGAEESFANALYNLGKYAQARAIYEKLIESKPSPDRRAWARLQVGNCARKTGDMLGAVAAYEQLFNESPASPWAKEAEWWAGQMRWWLIWNETMRSENAGAKAAPAAAKTP